MVRTGERSRFEEKALKSAVLTKRAGGLAHLPELQRIGPVEDVAAVERARLRGVDDPVAVDLRAGRSPGVEIRRRLLEGEDPDVLGQDGVERPQEDSVGQLEGAAKAGHLAQGVDAGVRPARAVDDGPLLGDLPDRLLEDALDGPAVGLALPAAEIRAVVAEDELVVLHLTRRAPRGPARTASSGVVAATMPLTSQVPRPTTFLPWILP